jgi:hypothetical protein
VSLIIKVYEYSLTVFIDLLAYLDRSNIGYVPHPANLPFKILIFSRNAKIAGMDDDLHISSDNYQWLLTIFYISYIVFQWFALMWKVIPPHMWAAFCVIGWGHSATFQAATFSFGGMMAAPFFLGFFEAGYGPGILYLFLFEARD